MHICVFDDERDAQDMSQAKFYDTQDTPPTLPWSAKGFHPLEQRQ